MFVLDGAAVPGDVSRGEGPHGVGDVVGAVREGVDHGREDLDVAEEGLGLGVEDLGVGVHVADEVVGLEHGVRVAVEFSDDVGAGLLRQSAAFEVVGGRDFRQVFVFGHLRELDLVLVAALAFDLDGLDLLDGVVVVVVFLDAAVVGLLTVELFVDPLGHGNDQGRGDDGAAAADDGGQRNGRAQVAGLGLADVARRAEAARPALGAFDDPEGGVDRRGEEDDGREEEAREQVGVALAQDAELGDGVQGGRADAGRDGREDPRDGDLGDAVQPGKLVEAVVRRPVAVVLARVVPDHALVAPGHERHADDAAHRRVRRRDRHLEEGGHDQPHRDR
mmetsp:Transcript_24284/g.74946  ORF Transcript_24284/g.74946 Transcript_24284/m.74946 type:complete len:334 (-) Transcript_24284:434-1435(-)